MKIFVGLGNPTPEYVATKHNVGFMLVDRLANKFGVSIWQKTLNALITEFFLNNEKFLLVKPQTFMNLSGEVVAELMNFYKLDSTNLIVAYDDMDLSLGTIRLRSKGSSGGHRGVKSIIEYLNTQNFSRVRIGIGRPPKNCTVNDYVLSPFTQNDTNIISAVLNELVFNITYIFHDNINKTINLIQKK